VIAVLPAALVRITTDRYYSAPGLQQQTLVVTSPDRCRFSGAPDRLDWFGCVRHDVCAMTAPSHTADEAVPNGLLKAQALPEWKTRPIE
jgi:hypothetical protein